MIKVLDQHTIDKIAAGEVIERPASVVKELVENSIDAGATRITVEITDGGTSMIRVTDNGSGIDADDVRKAYLSHATSKLDNVDDLMNIISLGFRGEALSTIAAVSKVEMITKTHDALSGIKYEIHGGKEIDFKEVGAPDGTTIISRNIFYNTPARLKFLKSNMTEGSYISDLMTHIALANPDVAVQLISNNKVIIDTQGDGRLKETIYSLYGKDITRGLLDVNYEEGDIKLTGFVGKPFLSKGNRSFENYFVNKRYIKSPIVNRAIEEAYKTHIMQHKFPYTALFIEVPPYMVDVNVHPAKREFRFDNEQGLFHAVFHAVKDALTDKEMIPDATANYSNTPENIIYNRSTDIAPAETNIVNDKPSGNSSSFSILESLLPKEYVEKLSKSGNETQEKTEEESLSKSKDNTFSRSIDITIENTFGKPLDKKDFAQEEMSETRYLSEEAKGHHKIIGQVFDTYWITEYDGVMYLMDQHAAHEKVNYERFLKEFKERTIHSQNLFPPELVSLSNSEKQAVLENAEYLSRYGFEVEDFGSNEVRITAMPANLIGLDGREVFSELVSYLNDHITEVTEDIFVRKLATMGCKAAIKGNQRITEPEVVDLIDKLMKLNDPYTCPHGRPTLVKFSKEDVDKMFKRIVD